VLRVKEDMEVLDAESSVGRPRHGNVWGLLKAHDYDHPRILAPNLRLIFRQDAGDHG